MRRTRVAAAALCAAALLFAATPTIGAAAPTPAGTEWHEASRTRIASLSRADVAAYLTGHGLDATAARHGVDLHRIVYRTSGVDGRPTTASALVAVPRTSGRLPSVMWLHGTRVYRGDTGSFEDNLDRAAAVQFATAGYATVAPDYLGLGAGPGGHPYVLARPTVTASLDALRAARGLARLDREVYVAGFSQGGQAAMLVGRALRADRYFRPAAVASLSGPLDIRGAELPAALDGRLDGRSASLYLSYWLVAWHRVHGLWEDPSTVFRSPYDSTVEDLFDGDHPEGEVFAAMPDSPDELLTESFLAELREPTGELRHLLARNDTACRDWRPRFPVRLYTSAGDRDVDIENSLNCRDQFAANGAGVDLVDLGDADHFTAGRTAIPLTTAWFDSLRGRDG